MMEMLLLEKMIMNTSNGVAASIVTGLTNIFPMIGEMSYASCLVSQVLLWWEGEEETCLQVMFVV